MEMKILEHFLFIHAHDLGALTHFLFEITSGTPRPQLFQIVKIGMLTFLLAFTR